MGIETSLRDSAVRFGEKTALIAGETRLTYAELDGQSDRFAAALRRSGIRPGDRILMVLDNGHEAAIGFFGAWKAGAVPCPLHPSIKTEKLAGILESTKASAIIAQARHKDTAEAAIGKVNAAPRLILTQADPADATAFRFEEMTAQPCQAPPRAGTNPDDLALLIHTSGSTGRPKGVMLSHANVKAACGAISSYLGNTPEDVVLSVLPLSHGYGITQMVTMIATGGTLVLEKSFAFPRKTLERLAEVKATGFPLVPPMAALIAGMKDLEPGFLPHLRYITSAAAGMPQAFTERLQSLFPETQLFLMYGQTECLRATYLPPEEVSRRPLSVGRAIPGTAAFVVDEDGRPVPPGTIGELVVEGPHVMSGYWEDGLATVRALSPAAGGRRLHTGDLFRADADGFLYFISRRDDIIKTRGEKVSPQEVERALYALPGIREAAVEGVDDPVFGKAIRAHVVVEDGVVLTERQIIRHCAGQLEDYMVPKSIAFHGALPRTSTGKIRLGAKDIKDVAQGNAA